MTQALPPIYFYLPADDWPSGNFLEGPDRYQEIYKNCVSTGTYNWSLQTYLRLTEIGFPCKLVGSIPTEGIVLAYRKSLPAELQPGPKLLIVCLQGDEGQHPYAQLHVVQNAREAIAPGQVLGDRFLFPNKKYYLPHWPQPGLIPRDPNRGDRFETIAYFGREMNLAPELKDPAWQQQLESLGLKWRIVSERESWNDYADVDAVIAVRRFSRWINYSWKPASKLYNAWHAGVPAILGCDSAFRDERKSNLDYLEVTSVKQALVAIRQLQEQPELRRAMRENGQIRAQETSVEQLVLRWRTFILESAVPEYKRWSQASNLSRSLFLMRRSLALTTRERRKDLQNIRNQLGLGSRLRALTSFFKR